MESCGISYSSGFFANRIFWRFNFIRKRYSVFFKLFTILDPETLEFVKKYSMEKLIDNFTEYETTKALPLRQKIEELVSQANKSNKNLQTKSLEVKV